jgi:hypothetical protein
VRTDAGIILYVIAKDSRAARPKGTRGPRRGLGLNKSEIEEQVSRYEVLSEDFRKKSLNPCCEQLIAEKYLKLKGKRYVLHPKATKDTLIQDELGARLVFALYDLVSAHRLENPFAVEEAVEACDGELSGVERTELEAKLKELSKIKGADYFNSQASGKELELQVETVNEERPYLDCVLKHRFKMPPTSPARAESREGESELPKAHKRGR